MGLLEPGKNPLTSRLFLPVEKDMFTECLVRALMTRQVACMMGEGFPLAGPWRSRKFMFPSGWYPRHFQNKFAGFSAETGLSGQWRSWKRA